MAQIERKKIDKWGDKTGREEECALYVHVLIVKNECVNKRIC